MVAKEQSSKKTQVPFRFLKPEEYEALSQDERAEYLKNALEALKAGRPFDIPSSGERKH
jgi:hypothetical protein